MSQRARITTSSENMRLEGERFAQALRGLRDSAIAVVRLGRQRIASELAKAENEIPGSTARMLSLMDEIECSFRTIRERLDH